MNITHIKNNIYVGDQIGASSLMCMISDGVSKAELPTNGWAILNVAWDLDIKYPSKCYKRSALSVSGDNAYNDLVAEHHKVGLVDGPGNMPISLAAAVLMVRQLEQKRLHLCSKDKPADNKNAYSSITQILVHCHSGHSRSVTIAGTYLYKANPESWKTVRDAISFVAFKRGVDIQKQTQCLIQLAEYKGTQALINAGWDMPYLKNISNCCD